PCTGPCETCRVGPNNTTEGSTGNLKPCPPVPGLCINKDLTCGDCLACSDTCLQTCVKKDGQVTCEYSGNVRRLCATDNGWELLCLGQKSECPPRKDGRVFNF